MAARRNNSFLSKFPKWASAVIVVTVIGGFIWANSSAAPQEREELQARCVGIHLLVSLHATSSFDGDERTRRATYVCFPGLLSQPTEYEVVSRNERLVEVRSTGVYWPYLFLALAIASGAWKVHSARRQRAA